MNKGYLIAFIVIFLVIVGFIIYKAKQKINLPSGKVTQTQEIAGQSGTMQNPILGKPQVKISTSRGDFVIELRPDVAPKTVANYLAKFSTGFCQDLTWHRVEDWVVQGCDPKGNGTGGESNLSTETSNESFLVGGVGVARKASPKEFSNDSQFFIVKKDSQFLDGEYTYFGKVIEGMDIVNKIQIGDKIISTTILSK
ncbi:MAG: Peptidyl-prolyl cis-trans isomerase cyclophilin type [Candidatus Amesbacteria bacterium GW2011_GWA2_42_12]|uniref:Peptidyl-prolyl cis-trans isomerase n=1 Tax=Candidatus Amesbacteria bacterium GW2011_GWA2_42_12 TaxID=1618356 RepID=A0A0G1B4U5_9BACT|nr:MAG: Peptidyl-prolyl cis-trans isomerase cyclophilin type [Candidatus Amesbacteria bacterium GW2011_GWA2_42_12]